MAERYTEMGEKNTKSIHDPFIVLIKSLYLYIYIAFWIKLNADLEHIDIDIPKICWSYKINQTSNHIETSMQFTFITSLTLIVFYHTQIAF